MKYLLAVSHSVGADTEAVLPREATTTAASSSKDEDNEAPVPTAITSVAS